LDNFDENGPGQYNQLFGLSSTLEDATVVIIPAPWEVTVSYREGTAAAPKKILEASSQVELYQPDMHNVWKAGFYMDNESSTLVKSNAFLRPLAQKIIQDAEGRMRLPQNKKTKWLGEINSGCQNMIGIVRERAFDLLEQGKTVGLLGGDHSTALGLIQGLAYARQSIGILQIDAHADLRDSFEGFDYSHASVMHHALSTAGVECLVQVAVRDFSVYEAQRMKKDPMITTFDQPVLDKLCYAGENWHTTCKKILSKLPDQVYISLDIDGLDPAYCPGTGTPVPGGLDYGAVDYLLRLLVEMNKTIVGFDLTEVAPISAMDIDAIVGARLLYRLCCLSVLSQKN